MKAIATPRHALRTLTRGFYDIQGQRISTGNRLVANLKTKLGVVPGTKEDGLCPKAEELLKSIRESHNKITDGLDDFPKADEFSGDETISHITELCLVDMFKNLEEQEKIHEKRLREVLKEFPIYTEFLQKVRGCGPMMSAVIISEIDIYAAPRPNSLWKFAGLDVVNGVGRSKRKEHLVEKEYIDKDGKTKKKLGITYNPNLKTKLMGVLADCFLRSKSQYRAEYDKARMKYDAHDVWGEHNDKVKGGNGKPITSKGKRHAMAKRAMIKRFLVDLHVAWRTLEGLRIPQPYGNRGG